MLACVSHFMVSMAHLFFLLSRVLAFKAILNSANVVVTSSRLVASLVVCLYRASSHSWLEPTCPSASNSLEFVPLQLLQLKFGLSLVTCKLKFYLSLATDKWTAWLGVCLLLGWSRSDGASEVDESEAVCLARVSQNGKGTVFPKW